MAPVSDKLSKKHDYMLAALIALPGFGFATANATAEGANAAPVSSAVAAVVLSSAVAGGVASKPSRKTYAIAFAWSAFSVAFEILQAKSHHSNGSDPRAGLSLALGVVRLAATIISVRALQKSA